MVRYLPQSQLELVSSWSAKRPSLPGQSKARFFEIYVASRIYGQAPGVSVRLRGTLITPMPRCGCGVAAPGRGLAPLVIAQSTQSAFVADVFWKTRAARPLVNAVEKDDPDQ